MQIYLIRSFCSSWLSPLLLLCVSLASTGTVSSQENPAIPQDFSHLFLFSGLMGDSVSSPMDIKNVLLVDSTWQVLSKKELRAAIKAHHLPTFYADSNRIIRVQMMKPPSAEMRAFISSNKEREKKRKALRKQQKGSPAPTFTVTSLKGEEFHLDDLVGRTVVLNFWFVDCAPCRAEIPDLNEFVQKYTSQHVVFLAIALDKRDRLEVFLDSHPFDYHIIPEGKEYSKLYGVSSYPTSIVIDQSGILKYIDSGVGLTSISRLEKKIKRTLR